MWLYVIPFVLLLLIAVFLKKREAAQQDDAATNKTRSRKTTAKKPAKVGTAKSGQKRNSSRIIEDPVNTQKATTPIPADLRRKLEKLIQQRNFSTAEAQINQALNRDNTQHELYLLLLEIHLLQSDEFAVNQLIHHIRSLGLDEIVKQAEQRQLAEQQQQPDAIEFSPSSVPILTDEPVSTPTPSVQNNAEFDALVQEPGSPPAELSAFEQLQPPTETASEPSSSVAELPVLEFNFAPKNEQAQHSEPATPPTQQENSLDFSFSLEPRAPETQTPPSAEQQTESAEPAALDFNFDELKPAEPALQPSSEVPHSPDFEATSASPSQGLDFKFEPATPEPAATPEPSAATVSLEPDVSSTLPDQQDPLIQAFPELAQTDEASLNLELAQQYIELGAYDAARRLLSLSADQFDPEQQEYSKKLLNQIAS